MGLDILFKWAIFDLERFDTFGQEPGFKYGPDSKNTCKLVNCGSKVFYSTKFWTSALPAFVKSIA